MRVEVGDILRDLDYRRPGRIVEVIDRIDDDTFLLKVLEHPVKPSAVGHVSRIAAATIDQFYERP